MRRTTNLALTTLLLLAAAALSASDEHLPTPYSAEQIRDAWTKGFAIKTRVTSPQSETFSITTVTQWSPESVSITDQTVDASGSPIGEPTTVRATWAELRDHALFPATSAWRERAERVTALGKLEGWLYNVPCGDGCFSELFFADTKPGVPVVYSRSQDGGREFLAEMIERHEPR